MRAGGVSEACRMRAAASALYVSRASFGGSGPSFPFFASRFRQANRGNRPGFSQPVQ